MERVETPIRDLAHGKWKLILSAAGIPDEKLRNKHQSCPVCGGTDRYRYDDRDGYGSYYCNNPDHGPGDGVKLLMGYRNWSFGQAADFVRDVLHARPVEAKQYEEAFKEQKSSPTDLAKRRYYLNKVWAEAKPVQVGDLAWHYYTATRGIALQVVPRDIRLHPALKYSVPGEKEGEYVEVGRWPAILALLRDVNGVPKGIHRTYLDPATGDKVAIVEDAKKLMPSLGVSGCAIRLFEATDEVALTEGIETGLAVYAKRGIPVWPTYSNTMLENVVLPDHIRRVWIYGDCDAAKLDPRGRLGGQAGQRSARALAERLRSEGRVAKLVLPASTTMDFNDIFKVAA